MTIERKIDELGRVCLPIQARRNLDINAGDTVAINVINNKVTIAKVKQSKKPLPAGA